MDQPLNRIASPIVSTLLAAAVLATASSSAAGGELETVRATITKHFPAAAHGRLSTTPVDGLYQLNTGARVYYVFSDIGRFTAWLTRRGVATDHVSLPAGGDLTRDDSEKVTYVKDAD